MKSFSLILGFIATLATSVLLTLALAERTCSAAQFSPLAIHRITHGQRVVHRIGMLIDCRAERNEPGAGIDPDSGRPRFTGGSIARPARAAVIPNSFPVNP